MKKVEKKNDKGKLDAKLAELTDNWVGGAHIYIPVFSHMVTVCVGTKEDAIRIVGASSDGRLELVSNLNVCYEDTAGMTVYGQARSLVVLRKYWGDGNDDVLYHECLHVASDILRKRGISTNDDELLARLQQYIVRAIKWRFRCGNFVTLLDNGAYSGPIEPSAMSNMIFPG